MEKMRCCKKGLIIGLIFSFSLFAFQADPFYIKLLQDAKRAYAAGNFDEALEDLRIAEFGLLDQPDYLKEIYLYMALASFKKGELEEAKKAIEKMKQELNTSPLNLKDLFPSLASDIEAMMASLNPIPSQSSPSTPPAPSSFMTVYQQALSAIQQGNLALARQKIEHLKKLNKKSPYLNYMKARLLLAEGKLKEAIKLLNRLKASSLPIRDEVLYFLGEAYQRTGNYTYASYYFSKVKVEPFRSRAEEKIKHINEILNQEISALTDYFSKPRLEKFFRSFPQHEPAVLTLIEKLMEKGLTAQALMVVKRAQDHLKIKSPSFYLKASQVYEKAGKLKDAIGLLEKAKKSARNEKEILEIHYRLGVLKYKKRDYKGAEKEFKIVERLNPNYRDLSTYLKLIKIRRK